MGRKRTRNKPQVSDKHVDHSLLKVWLTNGDILPIGYKRLDDVAEIEAAALRISSLVASMTIRLMEVGEHGHTRIRNGLSRMVDVTPSPWTNRFNFIQLIVKNMLLHGNSYALVITKDGYLESLDYMDPKHVHLLPDKETGGYRLRYCGVELQPSSVLHFVHNPDPKFHWQGRGISIPRASLADNLRQAQATRNEYLKSRYAPALILTVDAYSNSFREREKREEILKEYTETSRRGEPWVIPAGEIKVEQVAPLSIKDLAIPESMTIDRKTVAAIFGVPACVLGEGEYSRYQWNSFINTTIMPLAINIQQELTRKLIHSDKWFFKFNPANLYDYEPGTMSTILQGLHDRGAATGDELRHATGLDPAGLTEFRALENFIPYDAAGDQKKLNNGMKEKERSNEDG